MLQYFPLASTGLELEALSWHKRWMAPPSSPTAFFRRGSRVLGFLRSNENVNEQKGIAKRGCSLKACLVVPAGLIGPRGLVVWPRRMGLCVKDTWAKMADHDILDVWMTAAPFFFQGSSCQKGVHSVQCDTL